ncbi:hypothetical protein KW798_02965 [Candidatus Parcubacteria bacterium]|nr:hypothetical protein [Candidatus Parcubacteria bacterium]
MKKLLATLVVLLLLGYGLFEARKLLEGPQITIAMPIDGSATSSSAVRIGGTAQNISFLTINDKAAYTDEHGNFSELISPPPGLTVVTVTGIDRFGRKVTDTVSVTALNYCSTT